MMSAEWIYGSLGSLFDTVTGSTPPKSNPKNYGDDMLFVKPPELKDGPIIETADGLSHHGSLIARILPAGSILVSCIGNLGKVGLAECPVAFNQQINAIKPSDKALPLFMFYQSQAPNFLSQLENLASGTTVPIVNKSKFNSIQVAIPLIPEQHRIVAILDQAFADIEKARANAEKNLKNARELFDSYLNQVFSQRGEDWVELSLKEASIDFGRGKSKHRPRNDESLYGGDYPFVQTGEVRNCNHVINNYAKTYNEKGLAQSKLWPKGTICITIAANIAETGILGFDGCFPDSIIGVVVDPKVTRVSYVEFLLQSFRLILKAKGQGSAQDNINLGTFENMKFPFPTIKDQEEIIALLGELTTNIQRVEEVYLAKLVAIEELKKSLLQKAFSGELTKDKGIAA